MPADLSWMLSARIIVNSGLAEEKEAQLLRRIASGDRDAFGEFYDQYSGLLYAVALRILGDAAEAEDVLQEVFLQIWDKSGTFNAQLGKPSSWVITLARHRSLDRLRSSIRRFRLSEQMQTAATEEVHEPDFADSTEKAKAIRAAINTLPNEQRQAIELAYFGGLSQSEISAQLQEPLGTIKARIRRGMLHLRDHLEGWL